MEKNSSNSKSLKRKKVSVYTRKLKDGEDEEDSEDEAIYFDELFSEDEEFANAIQINFNTVDTNNKHYAKVGVFDDEDLNFRYTERLRMININVDYYKKLCYTKNANELFKFECVIGSITLLLCIK